MKQPTSRRAILRNALFFGISVGMPCIASDAFADQHAIPLPSHRRNHSSTVAPIPPGYRNVGVLQQVPPIVLYGVALQESQMLFGEQALPYPWTLNIAGAPRRFGNYEAAVAALRASVAAGVTSVDCGLMQVNWRYHAGKLGNYYQALDPYPNLTAGATLLREHYLATGRWFLAIGRYHNARDRHAADAYASSVYAHMNRVPYA